MSNIELKSFNQILGSMVRKIIAETPLTDVNPGSVFLSLLESCASQDFDNNVAILNILELLNVDSIRNSDLDNKAADLGLVRFAPVAASGVVRILNTNITKQSTNLYSLKPAPISGQTVLFVNNTTGWSSTGSLYIGRGSNSFEGPIPYTAITVFATYSQVTLGAALQKDHLSSDTVINAQGQPDRLISAGTVVKIPANNQNPEITYATLRDAVLPAGEDHVDNVPVLADVAGLRGNALIGTIRQFGSVPFIGAAVTNTNAFSSGSDVETDTQLRYRVKAYASSLARGTAPAIINAVINLSDPDENKRAASAILSQPVGVGLPSILYIDDGSGFQPSTAGQAVDVLVAKANGTEEFLQLANYPLPRAQVTNNASGPFLFEDQMFLRVSVDDTEDTIVFTTSDFVNIAVATLPEIVSAINAKSTLFKARLTNDSNNMLVYPVDSEAETIQVIPLRSSDIETRYANNLLNFPTKEASYIALFQNSTRLRQRNKAATIETIQFSSWNLVGPGNLIISVDGTPSQDGSFSLPDFVGATSFSLLSLDQWVAAINAKFAGITAVATPSSTVQISSNKSGNTASIRVLGGTYQQQMFATNDTEAVGQASEFEINRQTGNIRILNDIVAGDIISAGVADAKGFVVSSSTSSTFNFDDDDEGRQAQMVVCVDAMKCDRVALALQLDQTITISDQGNSVMRIMASSVDAFKFVQPGHHIYLTKRDSGWVSAANSGLYRVTSRGAHLTAGTDSYIEVLNNNITAESTTVADTADMVAFDTDVYPQLWTSNYLPSPTSTALSDLVDSLESAIQGVNASIFRANSVKLSSKTEDGGSIALPVVIGNAAGVFTATTEAQLNNDPLIANKVPSKDMVGFFKPKPITSRNTYLNRAQYPMVWSGLSANANPDQYPFSGPYAEQITSTGQLTNANVDLSDIVLWGKGNNLGLMRSIAAKPTADSVGTQQGVPRTLFDHVQGDNVGVFNSLKMSADDNIVVIMDKDATIKTIDIPAARTGQINTGSGGGSFVPTTTEFSANDLDNEPGVDFSTANVWSTSINGTNFADYRLLMRARNWYASGGTASANGKLMVRSAEFGTNGDKLRFSLEYPTNPSSTGTTALTTTPSWSRVSYFFGSGTARATGIPASTTMTIKGPYSTASQNFPNGTITTGNYFDYTFSAGDLSSVQVDDVLSILAGSGWTTQYQGQFGVKNKSGLTVRVFNPTAVNVVTQTLSNPGLLFFFPLQGTTVTEIVTTVNDSDVLTAAAIGSGSANIKVRTYEEDYAYVSNATALGYGHNPTVDSLRGFIGMYDGVNNVRSFSNANPNFVTKSTLTLNNSGVSASIYRMDTAPNEDATLGEKFKLVPATIVNMQHHLTQKALSQLPLVADVSIADAGKRIQIVSKELGSVGAIEILGGQANSAQTDVLGQTQIVSDSNGSYILANVNIFPNTYAVGDVVKVQNQIGVQRQSILTGLNSISVAALTGDRAEFYWNGVVTNFDSDTDFTITDVSANYNDYNGNPIAAGMIWRWTHSFTGGETLADVRVGHQIMAFGNQTEWDQGNKAKLAGDGSVSGLPIIAVNDVAHYFDVVNPNGRAMPTTGTGGLLTINIGPTPKIKWNLAHSASVAVSSMTRSGNVMSVTCVTAHGLNTNDSVFLRDSAIVADGTYGPITATGANTFTFANVGANTTEAFAGVTIINNTLTKTQYSFKKLGLNNLVRLSRTIGDSPRFADAGVAVDDYLVISGTTFSSLNNGTYRVLAVDNDSLTFEHENAIDDVDTLVDFNNKSLTVNWSANTNVVTGSAGAFKDLSTGVWVKKLEDSDTLYLQVVGNNTGNYSTATQITLGGLYSGISGAAFGVSYNMVTGHNNGVILKNIDDITVLDGDAAFKGDTLSVQELVNVSWFSPNNTGVFDIIEIGNNPSDYRPFVRVTNPLAVTQNNIALSPSVQGFYITESTPYKFSSYRTIVNSVADGLQRKLYLAPDARQYKFAESNTTFLEHAEKIGFDSGIAVGTDGYLFYTGLLRRAQRVVDGFAPDPVSFPERRAIGSRIEILPPLIKNISMVLAITTNQGSTLQDISDNVKSAIIDYVNGLGVGDDVILSAIVAKVMAVKGVAAVTFSTPLPSVERISIAPNEKALISADNIGVT